MSEQKVKPFPIARIAAPNHKPRTRTYPNGGDPDIPADRYEMFYQAFCLSGGSVAQAYRMAERTWDEKANGPIPDLSSVETYARHHDWRNRFLQSMLDPVESAAWDEITDAQLRGLKAMCIETVREVAAGEAGDAKYAGPRLKAAQTVLFLTGYMGPNKKQAQGGILGQVKAEVLDRGDDDLSEEEITRRNAEDWEREKAQRATAEGPDAGGGDAG